MASVAFLISTLEGLGAAEGLIKFDGDSLRLDFEVKDALVGWIKSGVKEAAIPLNEIDSIELKEGWFGTSIVIRTSSLKSTQGIPNSRRGEVRLSIAGSHLAEARSLIEDVWDAIEAQDSSR